MTGWLYNEFSVLKRFEEEAEGGVSWPGLVFILMFCFLMTLFSF